MELWNTESFWFHRCECHQPGTVVVEINDYIHFRFFCRSLLMHWLLVSVYTMPAIDPHPHRYAHRIYERAGVSGTLRIQRHFEARWHGINEEQHTTNEAKKWIL